MISALSVGKKSITLSFKLGNSIDIELRHGFSIRRYKLRILNSEIKRGYCIRLGAGRPYICHIIP